MKRLADTIQFERQNEVKDILLMISKYVAENPKEKYNQVVKEFYHHLENMDFEW